MAQDAFTPLKIGEKQLISAIVAANIAFLSSKMPFSFYFLKNKPYICRLKYHRIFKVKKLTLKINNNLTQCKLKDLSE